LAHLGRPEHFARFPVQRENVARSLFAAHVAHREDARADYRHAGKAAADGFGLPNQRWTVLGPVLQEIRIARNAVAIWTTKPGPAGLRVRLTGRQRKGIESSREDKAAPTKPARHRQLPSGVIRQEELLGGLGRVELSRLLP